MIRQRRLVLDDNCLSSSVTHADAMIGLAIGAAAIVCGVGAREFYALGPGQRPSTKTIRRWFGQLWCFGDRSVVDPLVSTEPSWLLALA